MKQHPYARRRQELIDCGQDEITRFVMGEIFDYFVTYQKMKPSQISITDIEAGLYESYLVYRQTWLEDQRQHIESILNGRKFGYRRAKGLVKAFYRLEDWLSQFQHDIVIGGPATIEGLACNIANARWLAMKFHKSHTEPYRFHLNREAVKNWIYQQKLSIAVLEDIQQLTFF